MDTPILTSEAVEEATPILNRNGQEVPKAAIEELRILSKCEIIVKGESSKEAYNAAIDRWNKVFLRDAAIIVFVESEENIAACLSFVQKYNLDLAIACGRHTHSGASAVDGGFIIDLKKMKKVVVDKAAMTITAQGGCQARDLEVPADAEGLSVVMGAVNDTGIGGLSLGGGTGFLTGQYGYVVDNILAMRVVLANGDIVEASKNSNPDLFWAMRGSGSNFGIVSQFTYRAHNQGPVFYGRLIFSPDKTSDLLALMQPLQDICIKSDGRLVVFFGFAMLPGTTEFTPVALPFFDGPEIEARQFLEPLFALKPVVEVVGMKRMCEITLPSEGYEMPVPHNRVTMSSAHMLPPLNGEVISNVLTDFAAFMLKYGATVAPSKLIIEIRSHEVSSRGFGDMAFSARAKGAGFGVEVQYSDASLDKTFLDEVRAMVKKASDTLAIMDKDKIEGEGRARLIPNLDRGLEKAEMVYGSSLPRLRELKGKYDPDFIFNKWNPIRPA